MAKLIGTDPNQVPTNADLGTMAYQDAERPALGQTTVKSAGTALIVERTGDDGQILDLRKDGSTVGSIGNRFGAMYVHSPDGTNGSGLRFFDGVIQPCESNGNDSNGDTDLGQINSRFKDLYLSGGIQFDSRSNKLDDYEEGTWTPTLLGYSGVSYSNQDGYYTKVGRLVVAHFRLGISSTGTYSGNSRVGGLPFNAGTNITNIVGNAPNTLTALNQTRDHQYFAIYNGGYDLFCYTKTGGALNYNIWQAGEINGVITYFTT